MKIKKNKIIINLIIKNGRLYKYLKKTISYILRHFNIETDDYGYIIRANQWHSNAKIVKVGKKLVMIFYMLIMEHLKEIVN